MRVIKGLNSRYTLLDLITGIEKNYHVSDMKPFVFDSALVDPLDIVRRDQMEFFIEKISDHREKLSQRKSFQFFFSWMGYDQSYDFWKCTLICAIQIIVTSVYAQLIEKSYSVDTHQIC